MGKGEGFQGTVHHQTAYRKRRSPPCMQHPRKKTSQNWVWVPKIPQWEKEFCHRVGSFTWEKFLAAKKVTSSEHKILEWDDTAAKEAFHRTRKRFYAEINGLPDPDESNIPSPDQYIDDIDWDDHDEVNDPELMDGLELDRGENSDEEGEEEEDEEHEYVPDYYHIRIEDIKPTGWNIDVEDWSRPKVLTGLIVGV